MSEALSAEAILSHAMELEREYDWLRATESYDKALRFVHEQDSSRMGEICAQLGYAFYRMAMQSENANEFRDRMGQAITNYEKAKEFYGRIGDSEKKSRMLRCDAMIAYMDYWLASQVPEKKRLLEKCWQLTKESLKAFKEAGDALEYGKTYNQLSISALLEFCLEWDFQARKKAIEEAVEHGEQAIRFLSTIAVPFELAKVYARTTFFLGVFNYYFLDISKKEREHQKAQDYWQRAKGLSEEVALLELLYPVFGPQESLWGEATDETFTNLERALEYGRKTKDKFIIGCALDWLTYHTCWRRATMIEDPDEDLSLTKAMLRYAEDSKQQYATICFTSPRADVVWIEAIDAEHLQRLAYYETDPRKKQDIYEKAKEAARDGIKRAEVSGYPEVIMHEHHVSSGILTEMAGIEESPERKKELLQEALLNRQETIRITGQLEPSLYWQRGIMLGALSRIKYGLADLAKEPQAKRNMLEEALQDLENAWKLCVAETSVFGKGSIAYFYVLGFNHHMGGVWLNHLYELTKNKEHLRKAIKAFSDAAGFYQKLDLKSRIAECYWKAAQTFDNLGEHLEAAEKFDLASHSYKSATEKIPQLKDFYQEYALYMQAWCEIEKARHHHQQQEYGSAKEHFENAGNLHKSLKQWDYLASNYFAWAHVEHAEELSRKEQSEEAIKTFEHASNLFKETRISLQERLHKIESSDEKHMVANMVKTTGLRHKYCMARIALEEARILDKKGDRYSSSDKYGSAVETFRRIGEALGSEQERKEFRFIITLSRAWQKMTRAEAEVSPELYVEASQLFEEAKELSSNEKTKLVLLGHSRFCRAQEAGTRFVDMRDAALHATAIGHLESAANYYMKAGFQKASEYTKATELLFDAYLYMGNAKVETDPEKKAKLYMMTEKVLQNSAGSFANAERLEKEGQVLRLLEKVRKERELAVSLTEVLHAPIIASTTSFPSPAPTSEEAVGIERFEHADVQANIIVNRKDLTVGETVELEIELANAGKGTALLTRIMETAPEGFDIIQKPEMYRVEGNNLNMKGKRLDPLKTEEVRLVLRPNVKGHFSVNPRVVYLDESGKEKSHEPEPITVAVQELGIKGWLRGER